MTSFIEQSLVFIGSAVLLVPIFHRLGFGPALGYLMAGILVGPHALGLIQDSESVMHFSELGVALLLFIIGLEIRPAKLWSMRKQIVGMGLGQILLCTLAFTLALLPFGLFSPLAAVVMGFGLSLSSTAFAIQTLTEHNQMRTDFGRSAFAILLTQDLVAIPAMAIIPALAASGTQGGNSVGPQGLLSFLAVVVGLALIGRFLMRPIFRAIAATRAQEIFTAATLFIVLGVAALMQKIGLSAALGTFIAGVLLADSEYRHELEANLNPFKSLLMGLFFISVGMGVALPLLWQKPLALLALTALYLVIKIGSIYSLGRLSRMPFESAKLMALNIGQGGEFAFVVFGLAGATGLASPDQLSILTVVITLSMGAIPLLVALNDRCTEKCRTLPKPNYDEIKDETPQVIIAGIGRFGQIFTRMLISQHIPYVAIDQDPEQIELLRKFGSKVYYGDASRLDILEAAGAHKAKFLVLAIDDVEMSLATVAVVKKHFPHLKLYVRARNRGHVFDLLDLGVEHIKRETLDSGLNFMGELLVDLGYAPKKAEDLVERFKLHDEIMLMEQYKVRRDDSMLVSVSKRGSAQLADVLGSESSQSYIRPTDEERISE